MDVLRLPIVHILLFGLILVESQTNVYEQSQQQTVAQAQSIESANSARNAIKNKEGIPLDQQRLYISADGITSTNPGNKVNYKPRPVEHVPRKQAQSVIPPEELRRIQIEALERRGTIKQGNKENDKSESIVLEDPSSDVLPRIKDIDLIRMNVKYENDPYQQTKSVKRASRSLLQKQKTSVSYDRNKLFKPIRISAYYDESVNYLNYQQKSDLKSTMGAVANYYEKIISVIPVGDTFHINRFCTERYVPSNKCSKYENKCVDAKIPDAHLGEEWVYPYSQHQGQKLPGGAGIKDTDLLIYVTARLHDGQCNGATAFAAPCRYDQYGKPVAGKINVCSSFFESSDWKMNVQIMLHQMTTITIMHHMLWDQFRDTNGDIIPKDQVYDDSVDPPILKSQELLKIVREHYFGEAKGLPLDSFSKSYWHPRYVYSETMSSAISSQQSFFSKFTLALMEDSGWYSVKYEYAEPFYFGMGTDESFLPGEQQIGCIENDGSHHSRYPECFCHSREDNGCNQDHSAPAQCQYNTYVQRVDPAWFNNPKEGGDPYADFCPLRGPRKYPGLPKDYESVCWDLRGNELQKDWGNDYGLKQEWALKSRCAQIGDGQKNDGYCLIHDCYGYDSNTKQYERVEIKINFKDGKSETIDCKRYDENKEKQLKSLQIRAKLMCPLIDSVCGIGSEYDACYWGYWSDTENQCVCSPGYTGSQCNIKDDHTDIDLYIPPSKRARMKEKENERISKLEQEESRNEAAKSDHHEREKKRIEQKMEKMRAQRKEIQRLEKQGKERRDILEEFRRANRDKSMLKQT